jgi:ABC-type oligopeptide transport system substrate-binding subunit
VALPKATLLAGLNRGQFELTFLTVPEVVEPHLLSWFFGSNHIPEQGVEGANRWRIRSPALDRLLEEGRRSTGRAERLTAYTQANRILQRELPIIPLWHEDVVVVLSERAASLGVSRLGRFEPLAL